MPSDSGQKPLRRPRWVYRLHAWLGGYFWKPCDICGRPFSGWEWGRDGHTIRSGFMGRGVCSAHCVLTSNVAETKAHHG